MQSTHTKPQVVKTYEEVVNNVKSFLQLLESDNRVKEKISDFRQWYYFELPDSPCFAPGKLIGYKEMPDFHEELFQDDGRKTEAVLRKYFSHLNPVRRNYKEYHDLLCQYLGTYGLTPCEGVGIHIPKK